MNELIYELIQVIEIKDIKKPDAGTYAVTITNKYGSETCPATVMVTNKEEEANEWKNQLKKTTFEIRELEENVVDWGELKKVEPNQVQKSPGPEKKEDTVKTEAQPIPEVKFDKKTQEKTEQPKEIHQKPDKLEPTEQEKSEKEKVTVVESTEEETETETESYKRKENATVEETAEEKQLKIDKSDIQVSTPLVDVKGKEKETAEFVCELNKPNIPVQWFFNEEAVLPSVKFTLVDDGAVKKLTVQALKV